MMVVWRISFPRSAFDAIPLIVRDVFQGVIGDTIVSTDRLGLESSPLKDK